MSRIPIGLLLFAPVIAACERSGEAHVLADTAPDVFAPAVALRSDNPGCQVVEAAAALPNEVRETSGLARSRRDTLVFWTHNDAGNAAEILALDAEGRLVQRVQIVGAEAVDWEDIEASPCSTGDCLFVGDIGDNDRERDRITVYRIPEPDAGSAEAGPAAALHMRFPDGAQDAEALFVLPSGELYLVTKGRNGPVILYRYPPPQRPGETVTLERVNELFPAPENGDDRVTAATASPDGRWVGIRTYRNLYFYRADDLLGGSAEPAFVFDLEPLGQSQGESIVLTSAGSVWLTSEAENRDDEPTWVHLTCTFPGG